MTAEPAITPLRQSLVVAHWLPTMSANGSHGHWAAHQKKHDIDRDMAWACARQAGWQFVPGRVKLTITLVYPRRYRIDTDNTYYKVKGLVDGLKTDHHTGGFPRGAVPVKRQGFIEDDSTEILELHVEVVVERGVRETRITLESVNRWP